MLWRRVRSIPKPAPPERLIPPALRAHGDVGGQGSEPHQGKGLPVHNPHPLLPLVKEFPFLCNLRDPSRQQKRFDT